MTEAIETSKSFQEKMYERIRDSIGDLMTDEDLKKLVDSAVNKAFFEERRTKNTYGSDTINPPWIVEEMQKLLAPQVKEAISKWAKDNPDKITEVIENMMAKSLVSLVETYFRSVFQNEFQNMYSQMQQRIERGY